MLNSFFTCSAYVIRKADNAQLFLWPQEVRHKEYDNPVTVQPRVRMTQIIIIIIIIIIIVCHIWYTKGGNTPDSLSEFTWFECRPGRA